MRLDPDNILAGIPYGIYFAGFQPRHGQFLIPVQKHFPGTVLVRIPEEDQAAAGNAVHDGTVRFQPEEFQVPFVIPAGQGGTHQAAVTHQRGAEQIRIKEEKRR